MHGETLKFIIVLNLFVVLTEIYVIKQLRITQWDDVTQTYSNVCRS